MNVPDENHRERIIGLQKRHVNSGQARLASMMNLPIECRSSGAYVYDEQGKRYLDAGGYGVFLLGHGHPAVVEAVTHQLKRHALSTRLLLNAEQAEAAAALIAHCPPGLQYSYFCNSGAEATEAALKLARLNGCERVIATHGGYHGKTLGALSVTGKPAYREPFMDRLPATQFASFGDAEAIDAIMQSVDSRCCVIVEPVQAEAGVVLPPEGYLQRLRQLCDHHEALLIFDEIQCGLGRTGHWWASERAKVEPDIMLIGKGLSGGCIPVAAMVARAEVFEPFNRNPLIHSSTFGGNPVAMAAVRSTIETMDNEMLVPRACALGVELESGLRQVINRIGATEQVTLRTAGLLVGVEFASAADSARLTLALLNRHVIVSHSLNDHRVMRMTPPAVMSLEDVGMLIAAFEESLLEILN